MYVAMSHDRSFSRKVTRVVGYIFFVSAMEASGQDSQSA